MNYQFSWWKGMAWVSALFPGANLFIAILPTPTNQFLNLCMKVPSLLVPLAIVIWYRSNSHFKKFSLLFVLAGALCIVSYLLLARSVLYTNPQFYDRGTFSIVGTQITEGAEQIVQRELEKYPGRKPTRSAVVKKLESETSPEEWDSLYEPSSQTLNFMPMLAAYFLGFVLLTAGFQQLSWKPDDDSTAPREKSDEATNGAV